MSSLEPIAAELREVKEAIQNQNSKKQAILSEVEATVKARMAEGQKKLKITLPIGIAVCVVLWGVALWMNLSKNTGAALETYPCAVPVALIILGIAAVVVSIWLGIPKEAKIRKEVTEERNSELEDIKKALSPLQIKERQLSQELERQRYIQR
ncbi:MAG: hypothetical protein LLG44_13340 [Chloroflexi bacterium]|nr:hypothetical protein [Chloroflexota bacterium]